MATPTFTTLVVSDAFLLQMAEIAAGLIGLFLVGIFFYIEKGERPSDEDEATEVVDLYFRASTRITLVLFAIPIGVSLTLVALEPVWPRLLFLVLSVALVATNVETARRVWPVARTTGSGVLVMTEIVGSASVAVIVTLPWILGGFHPDRQDLTWAILASFGTGFLSIYAAVMSAFDTTRSRSSGSS